MRYWPGRRDAGMSLTDASVSSLSCATTTLSAGRWSVLSNSMTVSPFLSIRCSAHCPPEPAPTTMATPCLHITHCPLRNAISSPRLVEREVRRDEDLVAVVCDRVRAGAEALRPVQLPGGRTDHRSE